MQMHSVTILWAVSQELKWYLLICYSVMFVPMCWSWKFCILRLHVYYSFIDAISFQFMMTSFILIFFFLDLKVTVNLIMSDVAEWGRVECSRAGREGSLETGAQHRRGNVGGSLLVYHAINCLQLCSTFTL